MSQYIGKTISLISNKGLRYVGLLDNINADDSTVALKSVRSFGTEGRLAQSGSPNLEVLPGNDIYDYVVFRGSDVKDLTVLDVPIDQVKPEPYIPTPQPPQPTSYYQQPPPQSTQTQRPAAPAQAPAVPAQTATPVQQPVQPQSQPAQPTQPEAPTPVQEPVQPQPQVQPQPEVAPAPTKPAEEESKQNEDGVSQPKPQSHPQGKARKRGSKGPEIPSTEFDFESANAKFSKELESEKELEHSSYNRQSSFFDTISSSTEERGSMRWSEEKSLNLDTFGEASLSHRGRGKGRGRGGWRGRGNNWRGGRGRGKFNYSNNDSNSKPEWA